MLARFLVLFQKALGELSFTKSIVDTIIDQALTSMILLFFIAVELD